MELTDFTFFKNTPLIDFNNTILFNNNFQRDQFFLEGGHYPTLNMDGLRFNFIRDKSTVHVPSSYDSFSGVNYCTFLSEKEPNTRYYAYVINYEYVNDKVTRANLLIDGIMTFCQGNVLNSFSNLRVTRKHLSKGEYNSRLWELKNNDDVIRTTTKSYFHDKSYIFDDFDIILQVGCDLTVDFGDENNPKIETSEGLTYDNISSPVNLYHCKQSDFRNLMKGLAPFPWIAQNISSIIMLPSIFVNQDNLEQINLPSVPLAVVNRFKNNGKSNKRDFENELKNMNVDMSELYDLFGLEDDERHLLRSGYTTSEVYSWDGQQLLIDNGLLNERTGIEFNALVVTGFQNEVGLYLKDYKINISEGTTRLAGGFLNDAIYFRNFDEVPMLIDNFKLSMARTANQREFAESQLITNRLTTMFDDNATQEERFFNATSVFSNFTPMNFLGRFADEHSFYKRQQAEFADLALTNSTLTTQNNNNALKRSENFYGITLKFSKPSDKELENLKKYYKLFGFLVNDERSNVDVFTNTICNYVQFSGSWVIPNVDVNIMEMIRSQFEMGVRLWHNNDTPYPMTQNVLKNKMRY